MFVTALTSEGLRHAEPSGLDGLGRIVRLPLSTGSVAHADAVELFAASLDAGRLRASVLALGLGGAEVEILEENGLPVEVSGLSAAGVGALVAVNVQRRLAIRLELSLDPTLYGELRQRAIRDPKLVTALAEGGSMAVKVGWMFTSDWTTASLGVLELTVGTLGFPTTGKERPVWMTPLLRRLFERIARLHTDVGDLAVRIRKLALSSDPAERAHYRRLASAVESPPFSLPPLELVEVDGVVQACFGESLLRDRQLGPHAREVLALCEAACGGRADVLVLTRPVASLDDDEAVMDWLTAQVEGEQATLEQVIVLGSPA